MTPDELLRDEAAEALAIAAELCDEVQRRCVEQPS
jgi:hypothetical protein